MLDKTTISADLLDAVGALRTKLLDLSTRNQLLSFRHPKASTVRIVDELPDQIFSRLVGETRSFLLHPVAAPSEREAEAWFKAERPEHVFKSGDRPDAAAYADAGGIDTRYEVPLDQKDLEEDDRHSDMRLQTLFYPDDLDARARKIRLAANTYVEETGSNALFLALGFLQWTDSARSEKPMLAPLVLVPVELAQATVKGRRQTSLAYSGEDIQTNLCLAKKLVDEFGIVLPDFAEFETPEAYFRAVRDVVRHQEGWTVRRFVTLGFFDFGKILLWRDLDPGAWAEAGGPLRSPLVTSFLTGDGEGPSRSDFDAGAYAADDRDFGELPFVLSADATQAAALKAALAEKSLVVEGPPGTGKSQTITNLIAAALGRGETVLFVAEKLAALEVVKTKLEGVGLGDFVLELHSHKTRKAQVVGELARRLALQPARPAKVPVEAYESAARRLSEAAASLGRHVDEAGGERRISDLLRSAGAARRRLARIAPSLEALEILPDKNAGTAEIGDAVHDFAGRAADLLATGPAPGAHPWRIIEPHAVTVLARTDISRRVQAVHDAAVSLREAVAAFPVAGSHAETSRLAAAGLVRDAERLHELRELGNRLRRDARDADERLATARPILAELATLAGMDVPRDMAGLRHLASVAKAAASVPKTMLSDWPEALLEDASAPVLSDADEKLRSFGAARERLAPVFTERALRDAEPAELRGAARIIGSASFFSFLFADYRRSRQLFRDLALPGATTTKAEVAASLDELASAIEIRRSVEGDARLTRLVGNHFRGVDTDVTALMAYRAWLLDLRAALPERDASGLSGWRTVAAWQGTHLAEMQSVAARLQPDTLEIFGRMAAELSRFGDEAKVDLSAHDAFTTALSSAFRPGSGALRTQTLDAWLAGHQDPVEWTEAIDAGRRIDVALGQHAANAAKLADLLSREGSERLSDDVPISTEIETLAEALAAPNLLDDWRRYGTARQRLSEVGFQLLVAHFESGDVPVEELVSAHTALVDLAAARDELRGDPMLLDLSASEIGRRRERFAEADDAVLLARRSSVREACLSRPVPEGRTGARTRDLTDLHLIRHQVGLQRAHRPIRELVDRAGDALISLKPCFMMGPISVAQYLAPGRLQFDLLIMDEASQIRPEDALGALSRAKRAVIVGDTKQLPPTNVFQRAFAETSDEEGGEIVAASAESVLEQAAKTWPSIPLLWHYRSQHHSLISFSNSWFYNGELVVFPSPSGQDAEYGIAWRKIVGTFSDGLNHIEAQAIAAAALDHMAKRPDESLGIVAMNRKQADLIQDLIQRLADESGFDLSAAERRSDPYFVKNLENVQGDERDVMMLSMTYGPAKPGGVVSRNFGPINSVGGERRLNVLFSRARKRMVVFASMEDGDILADSTAAQGTRALAAFLRYARTGLLAGVGVGSGREPDSPFEIEVARALQQRGFDTVAQVGAAGFFIDLAIRHPEKPGAFILGVECDGASYHSSRSARDRDRLRQMRLEELGWTIERIWSTDWFDDSDRQIERIERKVAAILASEPSEPVGEQSGEAGMPIAEEDLIEAGGDTELSAEDRSSSG